MAVLRINLLPEHFAQARVARKMMLLFAGLIGLTVFAWLFMPGLGWVSMSRRIAHVQREYNGPRATAPTDGYKAEADRVVAIEQETEGLKTQREPYGVRVEFIKALGQVPQQYVAALLGIEPYIYENARITSLSLQGGTVTMQVMTPSTDDAGRFYLNILRCPALSSVSIQVGSAGGGGGRVSATQYPGGGGGPPGAGPGGAAAGGGLIPVSVIATLANPIVIPSGPAGALGGGGGGGGAPGMAPRPGGPGGVPGGGNTAGGSTYSAH